MQLDSMNLCITLFLWATQNENYRVALGGVSNVLRGQLYKHLNSIVICGHNAI